MRNARILIIEDDPASQALMQLLLKAGGYQVLQAQDGTAGLAMLRDETPDLVLCDIHLPGMDGSAILQAARADVRLRGIPMLAVTAMAMVGDRERLLAQGFDGYIAKPLEVKSFLGEVAAYLPAATEFRLTEHKTP